MAAEIATPDPCPPVAPTHALTSDQAAPQLNPETPRKGLEDDTRSNSSMTDVERAQKKETEAALVVDEFLVEFDGPDDPGNPKNWSQGKKWTVTILSGLLVFTVTFASSIFSVNINVVQEKFNVSLVTATLGVALFVLGFVFGPIVFGPLSEILGRRAPLLSGYALFAIFQIPVALAQNVPTICVGRFLGGFFAAAPLSVVGGILADLWDPIPRAYAICIFAAGGFAGPVAGPIAGGFIVESSLGWRWTSWMTLIMAGVMGGLALFFVPETAAPKILQYRAAALRKESGNNAYHSKADDEKVTMERLATVYLIRPFAMVIQEPILALFTAYMSLLYGIVYLLFEAYPVAYYENRGWSIGISQLPFLAFIVGIIMGAGLIAYSTATNFTRAYNKHGKAIPEERLPPMIIGAICLPVGLFWFAWTSNPHISWVPSVLATALIGLGCMVPFWQGVSYLIDCYGFYANSAIAVNTFIRSFFGAFFPLFTHVMYTKLGVDWASSLLGFLCVVFLPVPVLFYIYGARIREKSKWAPTGPR